MITTDTIGVMVVSAVITEKEAASFITGQRAVLALPVWAQISFSSGNCGGHWGIYGHGTFGSEYKWISGDGATIDEAHTNFLAKIPPTGAALALAKRAEAAKLLREAAELDEKSP